MISSSPVTLEGAHSGKMTLGTIHIETWNKKERLTRAAKAGMLCWGLAIASVLIPILHFILVPALLLAGPVAAFYIHRQESLITGGEGVCPECSKAFVIAKSAHRFPLNDVCGSCHQEVRLTKRS